jgi:hypothetical protein
MRLSGANRLALAALAMGAFLVCVPSAMAELTLWNYAVLANANRAESDGLSTITIIGARNGTFSGSIAAESTDTIKNLRGSITPFVSGSNRIAPEHAQVRYAVAWDGSFRQYKPGGLDILLEQPPAEVRPSGGKALAGVWVTVNVPKDAAPGVYKAELTVQADGSAPKKVPVELTVTEWVVPQTQDWRTWIELIQSPDTLALEYDLPLWSERHWEMIGRSFEMMGQLGSRVVYIPLISQTNQGNEQSMVRWIKQPDGSWKHDYSLMEKYLDTAVKHMGKPKMVVLYAWDIYLAVKEKRPTVNPDSPPYGQQQQRLAQQRWDKANKGMVVSVLDPASGKVTNEYLPHFIAEGSREPWRQVFAEVRKRIKARGLEDVMYLGMVNDEIPSREDVVFLNDVSGGLPWIAHLHPARTRGRPPIGNKLLYGIADVRYEAHVYTIRYETNPDVSRSYGWKLPEHRAFFGRHGIPNGSALRARQLPEVNITGGQRGVGRIGADFWFVVKNARGERGGAVYARYPENMWRNLNIDSWILAPGQNGPVATARFENMREGVQECEARIFLESILTDEAQKRRIPADLAKRAQAMLDERQRAIWRSIWTNEEHLAKLDTLGIHGNARNEHEAIWQALGRKGVKMPGFWDGAARQMRSDEYRKGEQWFVQSDWKRRNLELYNLAAEVQKALRR